MRVVITIESGGMAGHRRWLIPHQTLRIGRSSWADFPVDHDSFLADLHFQIDLTPQGCRLRRLSPGDVTLINGVPLEQDQFVLDGDLVLAGQTLFRVQVQGVAADRGAVIEEQSSSDSPPLAASAFPVVRYRERRDPSGLTRWIAEPGGPSLPEMACELARQRSLHLVVNVRQARIPPPPFLDDSSDLLVDLHDLPQARGQLFLVSPSDPVNHWAWLPTLVGKNAVCCLFAERPKHELRDVLRRDAISYSSPAILGEQLACCPEPFVRRVLGLSDLVLIEHGSDSGWSLIGHPARTPTWESVGLPCASKDPTQDNLAT